MPRLALLLLFMLAPIAIYLGILGWINRRPRGLMLSGPWDFAGILFAASGFLFFGGPTLLETFSQTSLWRGLWITEDMPVDQPIEEALATGRFLLYAGYFFVVLLAAGFLLWQRRRMTVLYNIHPELVERVLGQVLDQSGLSFIQTGNVLLIEPAPDPFTALSAGTILVRKVTTLEVDASGGMCHVTLGWDPADSLLRREVEMQLHRALVLHPAPESNVGDWLLLVSSSLFFLIVVGAGVLVLLQLMRN